MFHLTVIRRLWKLPHNSHTGIVHSVGTVSIYNTVYPRFSLCNTAVTHPSCLYFLVAYVFVIIIGYNWSYGGRYCKDYFSDNLVIGNLY